VAQEQVLENEVAAAAQRRGEDAEQEREQFEHARSMTDLGGRPREVLPSDRSSLALMRWCLVLADALAHASPLPLGEGEGKRAS
jgi:hypothetical protein